MLAAFAASNNLTSDQVRQFQCTERNKKTSYSAGMIALFAISGVLGLVLIAVGVVLLVAWRRKRTMQYITQSGQLSGGAVPGKVLPASSMAGPYGDPDQPQIYKRGAVAEGLEQADPESPTRRWRGGNRVAPLVAADPARQQAL